MTFIILYIFCAFFTVAIIETQLIQDSQIIQLNILLPETEADTETTSEKETTYTEGTITVAGGCAGSTFGCCSDNETTASGPDEQGCPCNVTKFGCCPDGVSPGK